MTWDRKEQWNEDGPASLQRVAVIIMCAESSVCTKLGGNAVAWRRVATAAVSLFVLIIILQNAVATRAFSCDQHTGC
jgi:uncharacterized membrane protein